MGALDADQGDAEVEICEFTGRVLPRLLNREEWYDSWTEELVTTYHILTDHCRQYGLPFFEKFAFSDFIDIAYASSDKITTG